jgi:hypothetical protein
LRIFGFAPANSPLGRTLATIPLCILLSVVPFAMASAAALFVKITWVIAIALFVGLGAASAFGWLQIRRRRVAPVVAPAATHVITMSVPRVEPLPEPEVP